MGYVPDNVIAQLEGSHDIGIFLNVDTDPPLHLWFGTGDIPIQIDGVDPSGTVYLGAGQLIGIPTLEVLVNGTADSVDFSLSGVDPNTGNEMLDSIPEVRGCPVYVGITTLDEYWQPMSDIIPLWNGTASHTGEASPTVTGDEGRSITVSLTVTSGEDMRSRPSRSLWSHAQQRALSLTDDFCKSVARLARGVQPKWPNY